MAAGSTPVGTTTRASSSPGRPVPDRPRRAVVRDGASRCDRDRPRWRGRGVVARAGHVRACRRPDRRRRGRRRDDAGRVLADGRDRRPTDPRCDRVPGAARHGSARVGGRRRGARGLREVSGGAARRATPRRRLRPVAQNRTERRARRRGIRRHEPVRAVHAGAAWDDVTRVNRLAHEGWLASRATLRRRSRSRATVGDGRAAVLVALVGVVVAVRRRAATISSSSRSPLCTASRCSRSRRTSTLRAGAVPVAACSPARPGPSQPRRSSRALVPLWWSVGDTDGAHRPRPAPRCCAPDRADSAPGGPFAADPSTLPLAGRT